MLSSRLLLRDVRLDLIRKRSAEKRRRRVRATPIGRSVRGAHVRNSRCHWPSLSNGSGRFQTDTSWPIWRIRLANNNEPMNRSFYGVFFSAAGWRRDRCGVAVNFVDVVLMFCNLILIHQTGLVEQSQTLKVIKLNFKKILKKIH